MFGKSILINERDKITLKPPSHIVNKGITCILLNILFIFVYIVFANIANDHIEVIRITKITIIILIFSIILSFFYVFSFNRKFIFDKISRKVYRVDLLFFIPFTKVICNISDISYLQIRDIEDYDYSIDNPKDWFNPLPMRHRIKHTYYLFFVTDKQPDDLIMLTDTIGYYLPLKLKDLIIMGEELSQAIECEFKKDMIKIR